MDNPIAVFWLALIFLLIFINVFFALAETSLIESHKSRLEKLIDDGEEYAAEALKMVDKPDKANTVIQIGITLIGILLGLSSGVLLAPFIHHYLSIVPYSEEISYFISVIVVTYLALMLSEFLPRRIALQDPEHTLIRCQLTLRRMIFISKPIVMILSGSARVMLTLFGLSAKIEDTVTEDEVKDLIEQGTEDGTFEKTEQAMVDRVFHMSDQTAYSLMTPRTQMLWIDLDDSLQHNLSIIKDSPMNVIPVGRESLDSFCGVIYSRDVLKVALDHQPINLTELIKKPMFVPRSMETFKLLEQFRKTGIQEAVVMDEYGGVIGFITLNDIMMELVGDSDNLSESDSIQIIHRNNNSWFIDGLCSIDDFKNKFDINELPQEEEDHFQTMGGFVTSLFGYIPKEQELVEWDDFKFKVLKLDHYRLEKILCIKTEQS